jgi:pimeloyl-ACP methyl ester carboxylesterase
MVIISSYTFAASKGPIYYLTAGPTSGPLIVFVHGCPFIAMTWRPQLECFANLGFYVAAADTTGYGQSFNSREVSDYSMESQVADQLSYCRISEEKRLYSLVMIGEVLLFGLLQLIIRKGVLGWQR